MRREIDKAGNDGQTESYKQEADTRHDDDVERLLLPAHGERLDEDVFRVIDDLAGLFPLSC